MEELKLIGIGPQGKDEFGGAHENIALTIADIIEKELLLRKVIGLEGKWGAGKSNVIKILEEKLPKEKYTFFYYDAWAHQNELDKKAFLEELLEFLIKENILENEEEWQRKKDELLALTIDKNTVTVPKINSLYLLTFAAIFCSQLIKDIFEAYEAKGLITLFKYAPAFFLIVFIIYKTKKERIKFGDIFYLAKGEKVDITNKEVILEKKMRHGNFREYLALLQESIKNKKLIIVFDNIDRLPDSEITLLWSLIHTYFAEDLNKKEKNEIYVVIPYERGCIEHAFNKEKICDDISEASESSLEECFISKTIEINFSVPEPILTDWKKYFKEKLKKMFEDITEDELEIIIQIYKRGIERITPRGIITFLNYISTLRITNINKNKIKLRYYSLFYFAKNKVKCSEDILKLFEKSENNMEKMRVLFIGDNEWIKNISGIYFNVELENAIDVLLINNLEKDILLGKNIEEYEMVPQFYDIFGDVIMKLKEAIPNDVVKLQKAISHLKKLKEYQVHYKNVYTIIAEHFLKIDYNIVIVENEENFDFILNLLVEISSFNKQKCIEIVEFIIAKEVKINKKIGRYLDRVDSLAEILSIRNIDIFPLLKMKYISPDDLFESIKIKKDNYKKYLLKSEEKDIREFILDQQKMGTITENIYEKIEAVSLLKKEYNFKKLEVECENRVKSNNFPSNKNELYLLYLYRLLTENKEDKKILPNCGNLISSYNLLLKDMKYEKVKYDFDLIIFKNQQNLAQPGYQHFLQCENFEIEEKREILRATEYYFSFVELIESFLTFSNKFKIFGFLIENYNNKTGILKEESLERILKNDYKELMIITNNSLEVKDFIFMHEDIIKTIIEKVKIENISLDFLEELLIQYKEKNKFDSIIKVIKEYLNNIGVWDSEFLFFNFKGNLYFKVIESGIEFDIKDQIIEKFLTRIHNNIKSKTNWYGTNNKMKMKNFLESIPNKNSFRSIFTDIKNEILKDEISINREMFLDLGEMIYKYASINKEEKIINKFVINFIDDSDILALNSNYYELIRDNMGNYSEEIKRLIENKIKISTNKEKLKEFAEKLGIELTNSK